jgi:hypothetical protein
MLYLISSKSHNIQTGNSRYIYSRKVKTITRNTLLYRLFVPLEQTWCRFVWSMFYGTLFPDVCLARFSVSLKDVTYRLCVCVCVFMLKGKTTHSLLAGQHTVPYNFYCSQPIHSPVQWTSREKNICVLYQHNIVCLPCQQFPLLQFIVIAPSRNCREALPKARRLSYNL